MNPITRELIKRELKNEQDRLNSLGEDIDPYHADIGRMERQRDEIVDRIGALKEDLASEPTRVTYNVYIDAARRASA